MSSKTASQVPIIYNLFPPLIGDVSKWKSHVERAANMGFNWCFLNPIQLTGASGSLYSIRDYFTLSPVFFPEGDPMAQWARLKTFVTNCRELGVEVMVDLVINHTAYDNPLTRDHRNWYKTKDDGSIKNPGAKDDSAPDGWVTWGDLSEIDNEHSSDRNNLWEYWWKVVKKFMDAGLRGFRCDAAYQVPNNLWRMLIDRAREIDPEVCFFAESLGCSLEETLGLAKAGHNFVFNSGKWWDYREDWFLEQQNRLAGKARSICFPESHDTERLATEWNGDLDRIKQHYIFTSLVSSGVLVPVGFEYGFKKKPHVVHTNPYDYEGANWDITDFLRDINLLKRKHRIFHEDGRLDRRDVGHGDVLLLRKDSVDAEEAVAMLFNLGEHDVELGADQVINAAGGRRLQTAEGETPERVRLQRYGVALLGL